MKKLIMIGFTALMFAVSASFSSVRAGGVYEGLAPGKSVLGVKLGLSNTVGANVTYDYALARVWKGTFTIGGQIGYMWDGWNESHNGTKWAYNSNMLDFKVRTTYRLNVVVPEWEVYAGLGLGGGVNLQDEKTKTSNVKVKTNGSYGFFSGAFILGTSYNFTQNIGVNLEFDFGNWEQAWVNLGVNFKF